MEDNNSNSANNKNNPNGNRTNQINIELGEKEAQGTYSNLAIISHSQAEFIIDFTRILPGVPKAKVQSRIIMTPHHAKMLTNALVENMKKFEQQFGEISGGGGNNDNFGFQPGSPKIN